MSVFIYPKKKTKANMIVLLINSPLDRCNFIDPKGSTQARNVIRGYINFRSSGFTTRDDFVKRPLIFGSILCIINNPTHLDTYTCVYRFEIQFKVRLG